MSANPINHATLKPEVNEDCSPRLEVIEGGQLNLPDLPSDELLMEVMGLREDMFPAGFVPDLSLLDALPSVPRAATISAPEED